MSGNRKQRLRRRMDTFMDDRGWRMVPGPERVESCVLDHCELAYPAVRCVTDLACPADELMRFLVDHVTETLPRWSRDIVACEELERLAADERILLVRTRSPVPFVAAREDLFYVHRGQDEDGAFFEVSELCEHPTPVTPGAVRSHMHFASKHIHPRAEGCRYEVVWQYDPMGWLSRLLPRSVGVAAVHDHMKDECRRLREHFGGR